MDEEEKKQAYEDGVWHGYECDDLCDHTYFGTEPFQKGVEVGQISRSMEYYGWME